VDTAAAPSVSDRPASRPVGTKRVLLIVGGSVALLLALACFAVGGVAVWVLSERDASGYLTTDSHRFSSGGYAIASENLDFSDTPRWLGERFATVRIEASAARPVFVGIGPTSAVEPYLAGVQRSEITDVDADPFSVEYRRIPGGREPASPASQGFWRVESSGSGTQAIDWPVEDGDWSVVAMNADGSRSVALEASFGAKVSALGWLAFGFLTAGAIALLGGAALIYLGARKPRTTSDLALPASR
jgi:hypothetical protein